MVRQPAAHSEIMDLQFVTFGSKKNNQNFYDCKYGADPTIVHRPSGYINVTTLCMNHARFFEDWQNRADTKQTLVDLAEAVNTGGGDVVTEHDMLITVTVPGVGGTYAHPHLVPLIYAWLDRIFFFTLVGLTVIGGCRKTIVTRAAILDLQKNA